MRNIVPSSDLRNNYNKIAEMAKIEPVIITKNGRGDSVILSIESFEKVRLEMARQELNALIEEAELSIASGDVFDFDEVIAEMEKRARERK